MKKNLSHALLCIIIILMYSCHKDGGTGAGSGPDPVVPDLTVKIQGSVSGYVMNESGNPVPFAKVYAGDKQATTDAYGYFSILNVSLPEAAGFVKVQASGYFNGYKTFLPQKDKSAFLRLQLLTKNETGTVDAAAGGEVSTAGGAKVVIPAGGIVTAAGGAAYTGQVHISIRYLDPTAVTDMQTGTPGDGRGTDSAGYLKALKSYGIMAVELSNGGGQLLQIAPGKTAGIYIPIATALSATAPASIALWSFNDSTGLWQQQGRAVKQGGQYCGNTSHFSFWDGAEGISLVTVKAKITDASAHPLANVPVSITFAGMPQNAGHSRFGFTDADGNVTGSVFANSSLTLDVMTSCAVSAYSHPFTTTSSDIDLGTLTGNLGQSVVTLSGTVANCSNLPVTDGYVQTYDHGFYNRIPISNGSFSFTGLACTNQAVNIVAIDNSTHQQGQPATLTLTAGANNLGSLVACGTSTMGNISYTMDGITTNINEPADTIGAYYLMTPPDTAAVKWTQIVTLSGNANQVQQLAFQFNGGKTLGSTHALTEVFCPKFSGGRGYWVKDIPLTITEYGEIGGFISGSFTCQLLDFDNSGVHNFSCNFRVRRYN